jgi:excisionase family DNA binding protein
MTVTEAACYLGVTEDALYQSIKDKSVPHHRWGRKIIFLPRELDEWLAKLPGVSVAEALKRIPKEDPIRQGTPARKHIAINDTPNLPEEQIKLVRRPAGPKYPRTMPLRD